MVWNICSHQVPAKVGTNAYTNEMHKFYNSMVQAISREGGDCYTKVRALCALFYMGAPLKTQAKNGLIKISNFWG